MIYELLFSIATTVPPWEVQRILPLANTNQHHNLGTMISHTVNFSLRVSVNKNDQILSIDVFIMECEILLPICGCGGRVIYVSHFSITPSNFFTIIY